MTQTANRSGNQSVYSNITIITNDKESKNAVRPRKKRLKRNWQTRCDDYVSLSSQPASNAEERQPSGQTKGVIA